MSRDKQIEEMAKYIQEATNFAVQKLFVETKAFIAEYHRYHSVKDFDKAHGKNLNELEAEYLIDKGYRKKSDVAREIFKEIKKIIVHRILHNENYSFEGVMDSITNDLDELKKKYESEEIK